MARTLIQNISGSPITLPLPYSVVLPAGSGVVVADTVAAVAAAVFVVPGMESMLALSEVASGNPTSGVPPTIGMGGQKLTGLGTPTSASDAATKDYVDTHGGGGTPSAPLTSVQFNDGGAFGGDSTLSFNKTSKTFAAKNVALAGTLKNSIDFSTGANQTISAGNSIGPADKVVWGIESASPVSTSVSNPISLLTAADYGRVLWLINIGPNTITLKAGGTTLLDGGVDLALPQAAIAKFMFIEGPSGDVWLQTDKALTAG